MQPYSIYQLVLLASFTTGSEPQVHVKEEEITLAKCIYKKTGMQDQHFLNSVCTLTKKELLVDK